MGLEGNLRELALQEVLQLLSHTRKTGDLCINAPVAGLSATVTFANGSVVDGELSGPAADDVIASKASSANLAKYVESVVLELLTWQDGQFRFVPAQAGALRTSTGVRLNTDVLLMEGARRVEMWGRLSDRIANARAVPSFAESNGEMPMLNLQPQQWEILTHVDGHRDLHALAEMLSWDLMETAEVVYGLLETGLLVAQDGARARARVTPLSLPAIAAPEHPVDLWVPGESSGDPGDGFERDEIFDPVLVGVTTVDGLPRLRTPLVSPVVAALPVALQADVNTDISLHRTLGDEAARKGEFETAVWHWQKVLDARGNHDDRSHDHRSHAIEATMLMSRLISLLAVKS